MNRLSCFCISLYLLGFLAVAQAQQPHQHAKIRILNLNKTNELKLLSLGLPLDCGIHKEHVAGPADATYDLTAELSMADIRLVEEAGFSYEVLIPDMQAFYEERIARDLPYARQELARMKAQASYQQRNAGQDLGCTAADYPVPQHFKLGSMGGFYTYDEILADLDSMQMLYPDLVTVKAPISDTMTTIQGRPIYYVKISDNPDIDESEPEVLYSGLHHAREPVSILNVIYYMWYLLENYDTNPEIQGLVDNRELYFVPVLNPDGYVYNDSIAPNGGGLWRKNRRDNGDGTIGVDLNRNYSYQWGFDNIGSSPTTSSQTYRGPTPFSEPELQMYRDFVYSRNFVTAFNNHTSGNLLLAPWGYDPVLSPDHDLFLKWGDHMAWFNRYAFGRENIHLYPLNGGSTDWFYGEQTAKPKIYQYLPEIGTSLEGGFWPPPSLIVPQCQRHMHMSFLLAYFSGKYAIVHDLTPASLDDLTGEFSFSIERLGLQPGFFTLHITPISANIESLSQDSLTISNLDIMEQGSVSTTYTLAAGTRPGDMVEFEIRLSNGNFDLYSTTITKEYRQVEIFADDMEGTLDDWTISGGWGLTNEEAYTGSMSLTESPNFTYPGGTASIQTAQPIDLREATDAWLSFYTKWDFDRQTDKLFIEANPGGFFWTPLCGTYTRQNAIFGDQGDWVREEISLAEFVGDSAVNLRLRFLANNVDFADGIYIDDLKVHMRYNCALVNWNIGATVTDATTYVASDGSIQLSVSGGNAPYTFEWSNGETTQNLSNVPQGEYSVTVIDAFGCVDSLNSAVKGPPLSIEESKRDQFLISPNPAQDQIRIQSEQIQVDELHLRLYTVLGELVQKEKLPVSGVAIDHRLSLKGLAAGIYVLEVASGETAWRERIVVQK